MHPAGVSTGGSSEGKGADSGGDVFEFAVIGGGFAGLATAYFLGRAGKRGVIIEKEARLGDHASGRNAALFRHLHNDLLLYELSARSARFFRVPERIHLLDQRGSLLLTHEAKGQEALRQYAAGNDLPPVSARYTRQQALSQYDFLRPAVFSTAVFTAADGVADLKGMIDCYYAGAQRSGFALITGSEVRGIEEGQGRRVILTGGAKVACKVVINAAGAWAGVVGERLGAAAPSFTSYKRHLFQTELPQWYGRERPFVWHLDDHYYFREDAGLLLASICDETAVPPDDEHNDPTMDERFAGHLQKHFKPLSGLPVVNSWACLRTFTADRRPLVGWDLKVPWLFWVAGLGSSGVATAAAIGEYAATLLIAGRVQALEANSGMSPSRFGSDTA